MSRLFDDSVPDQAEHAAAVVTVYPFTLACWVYPDAAIDHVCMAVSRTAGTDCARIGVDPGLTVYAMVRDSGAGVSAFATTGATLSLNAWSHLAGVFTSATSRTVYLNGGSAVSNTTTATPASLGNTTIGHMHRQFGAGETPHSGRIEHAAIWPVALSANEILALARGVSPASIRSLDLASGGYWPLWGIHSPEIDLTKNGRSMTLVGTVRANGAPVVSFSRRYWNTAPHVAAAAVANPPKRMLFGAGV